MSKPLLEVRGVGKTFVLRHKRKGGKSRVRAVDGVSFTITPGQSIGVAGESGSGKSTLARMILRLEDPTDGEILFNDNDIAHKKGSALLDYRRDVQAVFQDSSSALSPRMRVRDIIAEPLEVQQPELSKDTVDTRVDSLLKRVGLSPVLRRSYPHELSGGQKQRVAIARSLIVDPEMLVLDEPVSALDVSVRSQVLNLLLDLQEERQLTYLMIAHDLAIMRHVTDYIFIMYLGRVVEQGPTEKVMFEPQHPYTQALVSASPRMEPGRDRTTTAVKGEIGKLTGPGCAFAPRCPLAGEECRQTVPPMREVGREGQVAQLAACYKIENKDE